MNNALLITSMKNEAPYLLEWLAYHFVIGFDRALVFTNDCADGTDILLDRLAEFGVVTHVRNVVPTNKSVQWSALKQADTHPVKESAEWVLFADCDEFVNIKLGRGHLSDLLAAGKDADALALQWRLFGNNDQLDIRGNTVLADFDKAAPFPCHAPWQASQIKSLFRNNGTYNRLGVHLPKQRRNDRPLPRWVNGSGQALPGAFADSGFHTYGKLGGVEWVQLNHYALRSAKGFMVKADRGLPNRSHKNIDLEYWADRNFNLVTDTSIQGHIPIVQAKISEWMQDKSIKQAYEAGLAWHQDKAAELTNSLTGVETLMRLMSVQRQDLPEAHTKELLMLQMIETQRRRLNLQKSKKSQ